MGDIGIGGVGRALVVAMSAVAMLFFLPGFYDPFQTPKLVALLAMCFVAAALPSSSTSMVDPFVLAGMSFWVVAAVFSRDMLLSVVGTYGAPFDCLIAIVSYYALMLAASRSSMDVGDLADAVAWASIPMSAWAIAQGFSGVERATSTHGSPVYLGAVLSLAAVAAMQSAKRGRRMGWAALALSVVAVWFTGTRGALLAVAGAGLVISKASAPGVGLLAGVALLAHPRGLSAASDVARWEIWRSAWRMFADSPWTGTGPGTFAMAYRQYISPEFVAAHRSAYVGQAHAHNEALQVLATTGIVGMAAWLIVAFGIAFCFYHHKDRRFLFALGAAYLISAAFNPVPHAATAVMALFVGAASAMAVAGRARTPYWALACMAVSLLISGRMLAADRSHYLAIKATDQFMAASYFEDAAKMNPWDIQLAARRVDAVHGLFGRIDGESRTKLAEVTLQYAEESAKAHPMDSSAHELLGKSILVAKMAGAEADPEKALLEFIAAQDLAPTFPPLMRRRQALAAALGNPMEEHRATMAYRRTAMLAGRGI